MGSNSPISCGDRAVIGRVYQSMAKAATHKTMSIVGRRELADEIVQEVFAKLWKSGAEFPNEKMLYSWIYKCCHNRAIDHLRSAAARREHGFETLPEPVDSIEELESQVLSRSLIKKCLLRLKERDAQILAYLAFDQMTQVEIAEIMEINRKTVQRSLEKIRQTIKAIQKDG